MMLSRLRHQRFCRPNITVTATQSDKRITGSYSGGCGCCAGKLVISRAHGVFAVAAFEPAHGEMGSRNLLKVVDECVVDRRTAERADNRHSLRRKLLANNDAETGSDLRY